MTQNSLRRELLPTTNYIYTSISLTDTTKKLINRNSLVKDTKINETHQCVFPINDENFQEDSRLTDEIELDGDSGSDDGLILPTLTSNNHSLTQTISNKLLNGIRRLKRLFFCCTPHWIPPKFNFLRPDI